MFKITPHDSVRGKRQIVWDDNTWDMPIEDMDQSRKSAQRNPFVPKISEGKSRSNSPLRTSVGDSARAKWQPNSQEEEVTATGSKQRQKMKPVGSDFWKKPSDDRTRPKEAEERSSEVPNKEEQADRHRKLADENLHVGFMFGSKALVQLIANPWIGPLTNKSVQQSHFVDKYLFPYVDVI